MATLALQLVCILLLTLTGQSFVPYRTSARIPYLLRLSSSPSSSPQSSTTAAHVSAVSSSSSSSSSSTTSYEPCFWKPKDPKSRWLQRRHLQDLQVGDELHGHVVQKLLDGKTGPKLFVECGVGRTHPRTQQWSIVFGMLRLERSKASVVLKRAERLRKRDSIPLFVSRVQADCGRLEVCTNQEDLESYISAAPKVPVMSLKPKDEVKGTVINVLPYGVIVDIGANRRGLLHIRSVAQLYGRYIKKEEGLVEAGLGKGTKVRLMVESNEKRRLLLDFTDDVKEGAQAEREIRKPSGTVEVDQTASDGERIDDDNDDDDDEIDEWAAYANEIASDSIESTKSLQSEFDDEEDKDEGEDEDRDIEDAFGLGMY